MVDESSVLFAVGFSPLLGMVALVFYAEVVRGRSFFGNNRRSISLARAFLFTGAAISQVTFVSERDSLLHVIPLAAGATFVVAALAIWVWQGWSGDLGG